MLFSMARYLTSNADYGLRIKISLKSPKHFYTSDSPPAFPGCEYSLAALTPELIAKYRDDRLSGLDRKDSKGKAFPQGLSV